jgi:hypothetical protein
LKTADISRTLPMSLPAPSRVKGERYPAVIKVQVAQTPAQQPDFSFLHFTPPEAWRVEEKEALHQMAARNGAHLAQLINQEPSLVAIHGLVSPEKAFLLVFGGSVELHRTPLSCTEHRATRGLAHLPCQGVVWGETLTPRMILVFPAATPTTLEARPQWLLHELGHAFNLVLERNPEQRTAEANVSRADFPSPARAWQFSAENTPSELFADGYLAWVIGAGGAISWIEQAGVSWLSVILQQ